MIQVNTHGRPSCRLSPRRLSTAVHFMTIYGEPSPQLLALVESLHMEKLIKWFSFVAGLDGPGD